MDAIKVPIYEVILSAPQAFTIFVRGGWRGWEPHSPKKSQLLKTFSDLAPDDIMYHVHSTN